MCARRRMPYHVDQANNSAETAIFVAQFSTFSGFGAIHVVSLQKKGR